MTTPHTCPNCQQPLLSLAQALAEHKVPADQQATLTLPNPPRPIQSGGLGCATLALSAAVSTVSAVIVGMIAEITVGTDFPAQGMRAGEAGVFSGVAVFIIVFIVMMSIFVWRQARNDRILTVRLSQWHAQKIAFDATFYCPTCQQQIAPQITS
ncbi:MAG: hypothetical protein ACO3F2_01990 [Roseiflexaceae bacterium]|jgi:hypothetical protein